MAKNDRDTFEFPIGRFLMWGLLAVVGLFAIVMLIAWWADARDPDAAAQGDPGPQVEWSIDLVDQTGDTVTLKGDRPDGITTETWRNDIQLIRSPGGTFEWDMDEELPAAVVTINATDGCAGLNAQLDAWIAQIGSVTTGEPQHWQARAFTQQTLNRMREGGCEINEATLNQVSENA